MPQYQRYKLTIRPLTAFATPLRGDTLFGQICWLTAQQAGADQLTELLAGYTDGEPFLILGDAYPQGYLPRPSLPVNHFGFQHLSAQQRKTIKGKRWLPIQALTNPVDQWAEHLQADATLALQIAADGQQVEHLLWHKQVRTHNSLNRLSNTTAKGEGFAPYDRELTWYHPQLLLEVIAVCDQRLSQENLVNLLATVGLNGYGKEASTGLGKFEITDCEPFTPPSTEGNAWLTLAPCAPQGQAWLPEHSFYNVHVRFGRHGVNNRVSGATPWKNPLLMADSAALLTPRQFSASQYFVGAGLGNISNAIPEAVHQGYAPVLAVHYPAAVQLPQTQAL